MPTIKFLFFLIFITKNINTTNALCPVLKWECDNGECINEDFHCNGQIDCKDGSDETARNCIHNTCPYFSFRCAYGPCLASQKKCDGHMDCADGSDEAPFLCQTLTAEQIDKKVRGKCRDDQMQCKSGQCIDYDYLCDGIAHCDDGTDETVALCFTRSPCPHVSFQCGYGACVAGNAKCNFKEDCRDGSDESYLLCNRTRFTKGCHIPGDQNALIATNVLNANSKWRAGNVVPEEVIVFFSCPRGYTLRGTLQNACTKAGWASPVQKCEKYCNIRELTRYISLKVTCRNAENDCNRAVPGTIAVVTCAEGFKKRAYAFDPPMSESRCNDNYEWEHPEYGVNHENCVAKCGVIQEESTSFAQDGIEVDINQVPWYVEIRRTADSVTYQRRCSGNILTPRLVISAAHCFWDEANRKFYDADIHQIAAGQNVSSAIIRNVEKIYHKTFEGKSNYYTDDVALLLLDKLLEFMHSVRPICLFFHDEAEKYIESGLNGFIVGWGPIQNSKEDALQKVLVISKSHRDCKRELGTVQNENDRKYELATDKFCLQTKGIGDICKGDSGSGFYIRQDNEHRLLGIISHLPQSYRDCTDGRLLTLTNVEYHHLFIMEYYRKSLDLQQLND